MDTQADLHVRVLDGAYHVDPRLAHREEACCHHQHGGGGPHPASLLLVMLRAEDRESNRGKRDGAMGGAALLDVDPANAINFDLVIGKTLESTLVIRNPRSSSIVFKVSACVACLEEARAAGPLGERRPRAAPPDAWVTPAVPAAGAARRTIRCVQRHSPLSAPSPGCDRHRLLAAARNLAPCTGARASDVWRRPSWTAAARALGR